MTTAELNKYLYAMIKHSGSDLHIKSVNGIRARIQGKLVPFPVKSKLTAVSVMQLLKEMLGNRIEEFIKNKEIDFSYKLDEKYRFRVNAFFQIKVHQSFLG
jgi:twitching motility protein PilT